MTQQEYKDELQSFAVRQRRNHPVKHEKDLSEEEDWHRRIIGGSLMAWHEQRLNGILAERNALRFLDFDPKPVVVFTTTMPGLVAAQDIMGESPENFVYLLDEEFDTWKENHPDDGFKFHIHHWNCLDNPSPELHEELVEAYPSVGADQFRFHRTGDMWGPNCGIFAEHLWQWTGEEMELLLQAYSGGVY